MRAQVEKKKKGRKKVVRQPSRSPRNVSQGQPEVLKSRKEGTRQGIIQRDFGKSNNYE